MFQKVNQPLQHFLRFLLFLLQNSVMSNAFNEHIEHGYQCKGEALVVGAAMLNGETRTGAHVKIPLKTLNRHGLIAGATGTGKTKSLQVLAENLSLLGVPVLLMDLK